VPGAPDADVGDPHHDEGGGLAQAARERASAVCSGWTRRAPRRPAVVPSRMPASATNEPSASVDTPVSPCPIEQPNAITPPIPISAAPPGERGMWRAEEWPSR